MGSGTKQAHPGHLLAEKASAEMFFEWRTLRRYERNCNPHIK
jgi:hypothetical protein